MRMHYIVNTDYPTAFSVSPLWVYSAWD